MENRVKVSDNIVLDSYGLLAYFGDEKGKDTVERMLTDARESNSPLRMTVINMGEVVYITERERGVKAAQLVLSRIKQLPIKLVNIGEELALKAAGIKAKHAIAYADCFAAGLAVMSDAALVTGDPEFRKLEKIININWI